MILHKPENELLTYLMANSGILEKETGGKILEAIEYSGDFPPFLQTSGVDV